MMKTIKVMNYFSCLRPNLFYNFVVNIVALQKKEACNQNFHIKLFHIKTFHIKDSVKETKNCIIKNPSMIKIGIV